METTTTTTTVPIGQSSPQVQYGWKCPTCGAVMAPWQSVCINCSGINKPYVGVGDFYPTWWHQVTCQPNLENTSAPIGGTTYSTPKQELQTLVKNMKL